VVAVSTDRAGSDAVGIEPGAAASVGALTGALTSGTACSSAAVS
jgi:hypothetical protein